MYVCMYACVRACVRMCVCSNIFSETIWPTQAKFNQEPPWDGEESLFKRSRSFVALYLYCQPPEERGSLGEREREREREGGGAFSRVYHTCVPVVPGV